MVVVAALAAIVLLISGAALSLSCPWDAQVRQARAEFLHLQCTAQRALSPQPCPLTSILVQKFS